MKIKKLLFLSVIISLMVTISYGKRLSEPVLITSAGQSADILMAKILAKKAGIQFIFDKLAKADSVKKVKSVIFVCGGSSKGLGAAKIDKEQEYKRVEQVIVQTVKAKKKIILLHLGGKARRGKLSDYYNTLVGNYADYIIVIQGGNEDGFFSKIAKKREIQLHELEKIIAVKDLLIKLYGK